MEKIEFNKAKEMLTWEKIVRFIHGEITLAELEGIDRNHLYTIAEIGYVLMEEGKLEDAKKIYEGLIEMEPRDYYFHSVLGAIYQQLRKNESALEEYNRAIELNPEDIPSLVNSAEILLHNGKLLESSERLKRAINLDKNGEDPWAMRARALVAIIGNILKEKTLS